MQMTRFADLGLRVVMRLGAPSADQEGRRNTVNNLAEDISASSAHVAKVVAKLVNIGVANSVRGRKGGIVLADDAASMKVGEVLRKLEVSSEVINCVEPTECPYYSNNCLLRTRLARAREAFFAALDDLTIADLLEHTAREHKRSGAVGLGIPQMIDPSDRTEAFA